MVAPVDITVPPVVREVCARLQGAGYEAYSVGGAVRDALLGKAPADWDVATSAAPERVCELFPRTIPTGMQHGTVTVLAGRGDARMPIEVTTFRGEGAYSDSRRPDSVTFGVPLVEDLARRDFTVNAIAFDPVSGDFEDPFNGQADLARQVIRAVGVAQERFCEDGLRVMRAVRFVATLSFQLDPATEAAIPAALGALAKVSQERVRDELLKLLKAPVPSLGLRIAASSGVLGLVLPEVVAPDYAQVDQLHADAQLRLAALLRPAGGEQAAAVARRLKLSNDERNRISHLLRHVEFSYHNGWSDAQLRAFVAAVRPGSLSDLFALQPCEALQIRAEAVVRAGDPLYISDLALDGGQLMAMLEIPPGRIVGKLLAALLELVLADPSLNRRELLAERASELHRELS